MRISFRETSSFDNENEAENLVKQHWEESYAEFFGSDPFQRPKMPKRQIKAKNKSYFE